jgi:exonuclease III
MLSQLRILQYNVNHGKEATIIPLLRDTRIKEFDILAIQEPWRNPNIATGYNPLRSSFYLAYPPDKLTRVCFYVNKALHPGKWSVTNHHKDMQTLTIDLNRAPGQESTPIQIHNVYNPSPASYTSQEMGTLATLRTCLETAGTGIEHVVIGDFNLHHPLWNATSRFTQHAAADHLIEIAAENLLELVTPKGAVTWRARGTESTIDLTLLSYPLVTSLIKCLPRVDLAQSSDHIPVETTLDLQPQPFTPMPRRCWKKADFNAIRQALNDKVPNTQVETNEQIDTRVYEITQALQEAIDQGVPWARASPYAKDYWTEECNEAVREARRTYYGMLREATPYAEQRYKEARNRKIAVIRQHQRDSFRSQVAETTKDAQGAWGLMRWAKEKANKPRPLPQLPQLVVKDSNGRQTGIANTLAEKIEILRELFFPRSLEADLSDIPSTVYPEPLTTRQEITSREIQEALRWVASDKAPGEDQIPNRVLQKVQEWLIPRLIIVFNASLRNGYHPSNWKRAITLAYRKPGKDDYTVPKSYRPVALLNTMGKLLELVMARRITELAETHGLLPDSQMGARKGRSAETALQLITEQVHTIWNLPGSKRVATLLSLDISGAFDHVSHERLVHNLRKRRIPPIIIDWVTSFLQDRETRIRLFEGESQWFEIATGIPQGSPVCPILFLFFVADLLDATNNEALRLSSSGFVDDINVLTYGASTERNCKILEETHKRCEEWAATHRAKFAPDKYEVIHLTRTPKRFNLKATPFLGGLRKEPKGDIRVLGVQIDAKLRWGPHMAKVREKAASQLLATSRITASTWGAGFAKAKLIYSTVVKPSILYGAGVWYSPQGSAQNTKRADQRLDTTQNQFLRKILGAYRAVHGRVLEKEADIEPITVALEKIAAKAVRRSVTSVGGRTVQRACERIRNGALPSGGASNRQAITPLEDKKRWLRKRIPEELWREENAATIRNRSRQRGPTWKRSLRSTLEASWQRRWSAYIATVPTGRKSLAHKDRNCKIAQLYGTLPKAACALVTQIRTEKIGLNAFLADRKVPGFLPYCTCGYHRQTAKHVIMHCPDRDNGREIMFQAAGTHDYGKMLATARGVKAAAKFLQGTGLLSQFQLGIGLE